MVLLLLFYFALFISSQSSRLVTDLLPGTNELESGYQAPKMLSTSEQKSKFRIFNLKEQSTDLFTVKVNGKDHTYTTPLLAQATNINLRKEMNCESISYTIEQFYSSYFSSNSFGVSIGSPKIMAVSLQYHETLMRVNEAITKYSQVVGKSTAWWGLYAIQLAPVFLLKFDPMFTNAIDILHTRASDPTTESQQVLYNQFVDSFGTHYVSRVIMGGTAHMYSFITESYHRSHSREETSQQISLMAQAKQFSFGYVTNTQSIYDHLSESFKNNLNTLSVFQPSVISVSNQSNWQTWLMNAGDQPTVINRTLSHIADLITDKPQVEAHLRRTVDFYLKNGFLPTLAQMTSKVLSVPSILPSAVGMISGLDVVGCGYDVTTLESRSCILDKTNTSDDRRWTDPYNRTLSYLLPDGFFATNTPESMNFDATVLVTSVEDYYRQTIRVQTRTRGWGPWRKRIVKTTIDFYRRFYQDYFNLSMKLKQIGWYTLAVSVFPYPKLNSLAKQALDHLPTTFDPENTRIWEDFFASYGTHLVVASQMGGQVWAEAWYEKCLTYEHTQQWITEQVRRTFLYVFHSSSIDQSNIQKVDENFRQFSIYSSQLLGGTETISPENWEEWALTVKSNPRPISYQLVSIDELLPPGNRRSALHQAINHFLQQAEDEDRTYISQLESVRGPPPTQCSRNPVRRAARNPTVTSRLNDIATIQKALCPYVGYEGRTCAQLTGRLMSTRAYQQLPVGVGMTIDITTGYLLFPAIDFTHDNNTLWIDPITNEIYYYPSEISVVSTADVNNDPIVRTFLTARELAHEWKYGRVRGTWFGGEFGHSKSILDLQQRFFSDDQAIAITQKPSVLYRLKVETLKLNRYALNALNELPTIYDETIYADFLRNWGTHIVQQSLVGGMHEQQVQFKDCIFSFNGAITSSNLEEYLKKDILAQTLGNSFYAERRKVAVDHKLGGDPSLSNHTEWLRSLAANPALLKIEEFTPWYDIVSNPDVKSNLQRIIQNRIDAADLVRIQEEAQVTEQRVNRRKLSLKSSVGRLNDGTCNMTPVTLDSVATCSRGCSTSLTIRSSTGPSNDRPLLYVRDPTTGFVQARVELANGAIVDGYRTDVGCSVISTPQMLTKSAYICVGCTLVNSFANTCTCVCPVY